MILSLFIIITTKSTN